jgi:hypothetical protein
MGHFVKTRRINTLNDRLERCFKEGRRRIVVGDGQVTALTG